MGLFDESGHLTQWALNALHEETLDDAQRLAVSEHLCCCDGCLERYTSTLCGEALMEPPQPVAPGVLAELERRGKQAGGLCAKGLAVAVCFTAGMWLMALLAAPAHKPVQITPQPADRLLLVEHTDGYTMEETP